MKGLRKLLLASTVLALAALPAASDIQVKDATGATVTMVTPSTVTVTVTPTVTAGVQSGGISEGGKLQFTNVVASPAFSGTITAAMLTSKSVQTGEFDLYLCDADPTATTLTDHASIAINVADVAKCKYGPIQFINAFSGLGTHTVWIVSNVGIGFQLPSSGTTLYGILTPPVATSAVFGTTSELTISLTIVRP